MDTQLDSVLPPITRIKLKQTHQRYGWNSAYQTEGGFRCRNCRAYVHSIPEISGVQNRNHCPYCLWSRHLDLEYAGDRLSACKATMQPIGLTVKRGKDKYGRERSGELMLIHCCSECGWISINRIAADDLADSLVSVMHAASELEALTVDQIESTGIRLLRPEDAMLVEWQLFGNLAI